MEEVQVPTDNFLCFLTGSSALINEDLVDKYINNFLRGVNQYQWKVKGVILHLLAKDHGHQVLVPCEFSKATCVFRAPVFVCCLNTCKNKLSQSCPLFLSIKTTANTTKRGGGGIERKGKRTCWLLSGVQHWMLPLHWTNLTNMEHTSGGVSPHSLADSTPDDQPGQASTQLPFTF